MTVSSDAVTPSTPPPRMARRSGRMRTSGAATPSAPASAASPVIVAARKRTCEAWRAAKNQSTSTHPLAHHDLGNAPTASSRARECSHCLTKSSEMLDEPIACILFSCIPLSCEKRTMTTLILEKRATAVSVRGISTGRTKRRRRTLTWQGLRSQGCMG